MLTNDFVNFEQPAPGYLTLKDHVMHNNGFIGHIFYVTTISKMMYGGGGIIQ